MSYALLQSVIVAILVAGALAFTVWRLAGPFGRQRLLRTLAASLQALRLHGAARRIETTRLRLAASQSASPCANCGPGAQQAHSPDRSR